MDTDQLPDGHVHADRADRARRGTGGRHAGHDDATGELTLHGDTNPVTVDVTAQTNGDTHPGVRSADVLFADYEIHNPSLGITTRTTDCWSSSL